MAFNLQRASWSAFVIVLGLSACATEEMLEVHPLNRLKVNGALVQATGKRIPIAVGQLDKCSS